VISIFTIGMHWLQLLPISCELLVTLNEVMVVPRIRIDIPFGKHRREGSSASGSMHSYAVRSGCREEGCSCTVQNAPTASSTAYWASSKAFVVAVITAAADGAVADADMEAAEKSLKPVHTTRYVKLGRSVNFYQHT
jgi:hypothetical protein